MFNEKVIEQPKTSKPYQIFTSNKIEDNLSSSTVAKLIVFRNKLTRKLLTIKAKEA
jgi:hypothetical protein